MAFPACTSGIEAASGTSNVVQGLALDINVPFQTAPTLPSIRCGVELRDARTTSATWELQCQVMSGPGPVYTLEYVAAQLNGAFTGPAQVLNNFSLGSVLPHAGRPFNWQTDIFRYHLRANFTGAGNLTSGTGMSVCNVEASVADCCSELNAKLDQVLNFIAKQYFTQP